MIDMTPKDMVALAFLIIASAAAYKIVTIDDAIFNGKPSICSQSEKTEPAQ